MLDVYLLPSYALELDELEPVLRPLESHLLATQLKLGAAYAEITEMTRKNTGRVELFG